MARAKLFYVPRDTQGRAIQGGLVDVYEVGTSTPVTDLFLASSGGSPVAQLTSDASGAVVAWLATARDVKLRVRNNGTSTTAGGVRVTSLDKSFDNVPVFPAVNEIAQLDETQTFAGNNTFSGTVTLSGSSVYATIAARPAASGFAAGTVCYVSNVERWYRSDGTAWVPLDGAQELNLLDYGAVPTTDEDLTAPDTALALEAAILDFRNGKKWPIVAPTLSGDRGIYNFHTTVNVNFSGGAGARITGIKIVGRGSIDGFGVQHYNDQGATFLGTATLAGDPILHFERTDSGVNTSGVVESISFISRGTCVLHANTTNGTFVAGMIFYRCAFRATDVLGTEPAPVKLQNAFWDRFHDCTFASANFNSYSMRMIGTDSLAAPGVGRSVYLVQFFGLTRVYPGGFLYHQKHTSTGNCGVLLFESVQTENMSAYGTAGALLTIVNDGLADQTFVGSRFGNFQHADPLGTTPPVVRIMPRGTGGCDMNFIGNVFDTQQLSTGGVTGTLYPMIQVMDDKSVLKGNHGINGANLTVVDANYKAISQLGSIQRRHGWDCTGQDDEPDLDLANFLDGAPLRVFTENEKWARLAINANKIRFGPGSRTFADGVFTEGSTTFTSATAAFVATDTGKRLWGLQRRVVSDAVIYATTLAAGIDAVTTTVTVASAAGFPATNNYEIAVDNEKMLVTAGAGTTTWTVTRAYDSTSAATHALAAVVRSPQITSATAAFVAGDVGRVVEAYWTDGSIATDHDHLASGTEIVTVVNGTTVIVDNPVLAARTGVRFQIDGGVLDDNTTITYVSATQVTLSTAAQGTGTALTTFVGGIWDASLERSADATLLATGKLAVTGELEVDGALNHDGTTVGFFGVAPVARAGTTDDIKDALVAYGLLQGTSNTPLNLDGGNLTANSGTFASTVTGTRLIASTDGSAAAPAVELSNHGIYRVSSTKMGFAVNDILQLSLSTTALDFTDAINVILGTATGTKFGTGATQKIGFFGATPVVQPAANADTSGATLAALETEVNELKAVLRSLGLMA